MKMTDYPCLYRLADADISIQCDFFCGLSSIFGLSSADIIEHAAFFAHTSQGVLFHGSGLTDDDIKNFGKKRLDRPLADCKSLAALFSNYDMKNEACQNCKLSHNYKNKWLSDERMLLAYILQRGKNYEDLLFDLNEKNFCSVCFLVQGKSLRSYPLITFNKYLLSYLKSLPDLENLAREELVNGFAPYLHDMVRKAQRSKKIIDATTPAPVSISFNDISDCVKREISFIYNIRKETLTDVQIAKCRTRNRDVSRYIYTPPKIKRGIIENETSDVSSALNDIDNSARKKKVRSSSSGPVFQMDLFDMVTHDEPVAVSLTPVSILEPTADILDNSFEETTDSDMSNQTDEKPVETSVLNEQIETLTVSETNAIVSNVISSSFEENSVSEETTEDIPSDVGEETIMNDELAIEISHNESRLDDDNGEVWIYATTDNSQHEELQMSTTVTEEPAEDTLDADASDNSETSELPIDELIAVVTEVEESTSSDDSASSEEPYTDDLVGPITVDFSDYGNSDIFFKSNSYCPNACIDCMSVTSFNLNCYIKQDMNEGVLSDLDSTLCDCRDVTGQLDSTSYKTCFHHETCGLMYPYYDLNDTFFNCVIDCSIDDMKNIHMFLTDSCSSTEICIEAVRYHLRTGLLFFMPCSQKFYFFDMDYSYTNFLQPILGTASKIKFLSLNSVPVYYMFEKLGFKHVYIESLSNLFSVAYGIEYNVPFSLLLRSSIGVSKISDGIDFYQFAMPLYSKVYKKISDAIMESQDVLNVLTSIRNANYFNRGLSTAYDLSEIVLGLHSGVSGMNHNDYVLHYDKEMPIISSGFLYVIRFPYLKDVDEKSRYEFFHDVVSSVFSLPYNSVQYAKLLSVSPSLIAFFCTHEGDLFFDLLLDCARKLYGEKFNTVPVIDSQRIKY